MKLQNIIIAALVVACLIFGFLWLRSERKVTELTTDPVITKNNKERALNIDSIKTAFENQQKRIDKSDSLLRATRTELQSVKNRLTKAINQRPNEALIHPDSITIERFRYITRPFDNANSN